MFYPRNAPIGVLADPTIYTGGTDGMIQRIFLSQDEA